MDKKTCELFLKVDILFENGKLNLAKTNKQFGKFMRDCPYDNASAGYKCKTDLEGINGLSSHLFTELFKRSKDTQKRENNDSQYIEYVMMWLGYRLYQTESYSSSTLLDFYNNYLMKSHILSDHSDLIMKKKHLKDADLYYMSRFYQLFQQICYITLVYSKNISNPQGINKDSTNFCNKYTSLYNDISECDSYLILLNNLRTQYENLKNYLINNNPSRRRFHKGAIIANFKDLPPRKQSKKTFTVGFSSPGCKKADSKSKKKKPKPPPKAREPVNHKPGRSSPASKIPSPPTKKQLTLKSKAEKAEQKPPLPPQQVLPPPAKPEPVKPNPAASSPSESSQQPSHSQQGEKQSSSSPPEPQPEPATTIHKESSDSQDASNTAVDQLSNQEGTSKSSDSSQHKTTNEIGKQGGETVHKREQSPDGQQQNSGSKQENSIGGPENSDVLENRDKIPSTDEPEKQPLVSETKEPSSPETSQQTQSDPAQPESQNVPESKKPQKEGSNHSDGQGASKSETKDSGSESGNGDDGANEPGAPSGGTGDPPSGNHPLNQGGKPDITSPLNQTETSTPGGSFDLGPLFREFLLNGTKFYNKASQFIKDTHQKFKEATDKINDVYNDTVDNLKRVYNVSSIYFSAMLNSITSQLDQVGTPKPGSSGDSLPQNSDQSKETGGPLPPQPSTQPKDSTQITSPDPSQDPPSNLPLPPPPNPPPISSQQNQLSPQSQSNTLQNQQTSQPTQKIIAQLAKSPSSDDIFRTPWNIIPTTWNGSGDCKPEVNFMNATLVCCTSEQCSLTGISVMLVLIPIILLIVYKYLSSGWRKEMKRKKNMKKVINSIGGKKTTQIIINLSSQKKKIKKPINSVYGKKPSLLNIYKHMQADPVPFINLFFLLIFFVYKRKRDTIE
ncbi:Plasmodium variant antigen protein Cir/Yir/Bir, putative [Plasmodium chabaudi adami]|uniref:Plasmodium variant antigen protein Cir/Yir/Bir, putative n=1 Tax=Plasmodium chabaudi adami TaxID=5826 RepID=A0A1D3L9Z6_PLACE|nr:Plasmodium variant antigen protein Cir/Yir/Bir, putative [Plasmodium chabaudi adami]